MVMNDEFEKQYMPLEKTLYIVALSYVKNTEDAKDMVQEAALAAYKSYSKLRHREYFKTWMTRILINKCLDFLNKKKAPEYIIDSEQMFSELPTQELEILDTICRLPNKLRPLIVLRFYHGFTYQETACTLRISESLAKYRTKLALQKLEEMLGDVI